MQNSVSPQDKDRLRQISPEGLFNLGASDVVYVKSLEAEGKTMFALHAANGAPVAAVESRDAAIALARQNDMTLLSVH